MKRSFPKKLLCLCMVAVLAFGISLPTFADVTTNTQRHIQNISISGTSKVYLNLEGSGLATTNRNVTTYSYTSSGDQFWYIENRGNGCKVYSAQSSTDGRNYTLNVNKSTWNCNIYPDTASNNEDSVVVTPGSASAFVIDLAYHRSNELQTNIGSSNFNVGWGGTSIHNWALA